MGQRHQIFIRIVNPAKHALCSTKNELKTLESKFGSADTAITTILPYHNQWLYGRSAVSNCLRLLKFSKQFSKEDKTTKEGFGGYDCPFTVNGIRTHYSDADKLTGAIAMIMNIRPTNTSWLAAGIDKSFYIGDSDESIREDFTMGDNNDGITIIDLIENKYCFMNIYKQDKKATHGIYSLPMLKPLDARKYVRAYYGETIETTNPYHFGDHDMSKVTKTVAEMQRIVDQAIKTNNQAVRGFDKFEVLTLSEVQAMFPKMKLIKPKLVK